MPKALVLLFLLVGCGVPPEQCNTGEVACQPGLDRCFMTCRGGQWEADSCLPKCGPGARTQGANESSCAFPDVVCMAD